MAKVQTCSHDRMHQSIKEAGDPGHGRQENTHHKVHDNSVAKWITGGHKSVKTHNDQQDGLSTAQKVEEV